MDSRLIKKRMGEKFHRDYSKFYPVNALKKMGYHRNICKNCKKGFWSIDERERCDDCVGEYSFIGNTPMKKKWGYKESWDNYVKYFKKWGYVPIDRYPVVARWYDELFFVDAGVNIFQPYTISGEVEPQHREVLEPQFCLRFNDVENTGITGRHYVGFVMAGQHTFSTQKHKSFFKEQALPQMHEFLTKGMGIPAHEVIYHEDIWAGGGNFGPCLEFFVRGLELGNQVYMQYESLPSGGYRELKTRVVDMGAGLERWTWMSQGRGMSYDHVFPYVLKNIYKNIDFRVDKKFMDEFVKYSYLLDVQDEKPICGHGSSASGWDYISSRMKMDRETLKGLASKQAAAYAIADHVRALLVAMHDGGLPSNVGGGYNLRNILRRTWSLIDKHNWDLKIEDVFDWTIKEFGSWFRELNNKGRLYEILESERAKYQASADKGRKQVVKCINCKIGRKELVELYQSFGVMPEQVTSVANEMNKKVEIPPNIYSSLKVLGRIAKPRRKFGVGNLKTKKMYYKDQEKSEFEAKVIGKFGNMVVLDRTYFYPTSGGQLHDMGTINGLKVLDVVKEGDAVLHKLSKPVSGKVKCVVDISKRRIIEQMHTSTHILSGACQKLLGPHVWQNGAEKTFEKARLDITHYQNLTKEEIRELERMVNKVIMEARPVIVEELERSEAERKHGIRIYQGGAVPGKVLRIVSVKDWDVEACGGLHCRNTSEVGFFKIVGTEKVQDGLVRIHFLAGEKALEYLWETEEIMEKVSDLWSVQKEIIPNTAERFFREWKQQKKDIIRITETLVSQAVKNRNSEELALNLPVSDMGFLARLLSSNPFDGTLVLIGEGIGVGVGKNAEKMLREKFKNIKPGKLVRAWD